MNTRSLLPFTRLVLIVSAVVQLLVGGIMVFALDVARRVLYQPQQNFAPLAVEFFGVFYLANGLGAVYALFRNNWAEAREYLVIAWAYVALSLLMTVYALLAASIFPPVAYVTFLLGLVYLPIVIWVWRSESRRVESAGS